MTYYYFLVSYKGGQEEDLYIDTNKEKLEKMRKEYKASASEEETVMPIEEVEGDYLVLPRLGGIRGGDYS